MPPAGTVTLGELNVTVVSGSQKSFRSGPNVWAPVEIATTSERS